MAGLIYIVATITLARGTRASRRVALVAIIIELVGVITVGTLSVVDPAAFPRATVWSVYGIGSLFRSAAAADSRAGLAVAHPTPLIWAFAHPLGTPPPSSSGLSLVRRARVELNRRLKIVRREDPKLDVVREVYRPH